MLSKSKKLIGCICLVLCFGVVIIGTDKIHNKSQNFDEHDVMEKTKDFLMERANLLCGEKSNLQITSSFYEPFMVEEEAKEATLREDISSYGELIKESGNIYTDPKITLDFIKRVKDERGKVVIKAKEEVMYTIKDSSTETGFANEHIFTFKEIEGKWKLVKDEVLGEHSMISPVKKD